MHFVIWPLKYPHPLPHKHKNVAHKVLIEKTSVFNYRHAFSLPDKCQVQVRKFSELFHVLYILYGAPNENQGLIISQFWTSPCSF